MTAILISRVKDCLNKTDIIYLVADQRVSSDDRIISNSNKKIFTFGPNKVRDYTRHYITVGDVAPTDYILHKLEDINDMDSLYKFVLESDLFVKMPHEADIYMIDECPGMPRIIELIKSKDYTGIRVVDLDELIDMPLYSGSGGLYTLTALTALRDVKYKIEGHIDYKYFLKLAFTAAAKYITSMNDTLTIIEIKLPILKKSTRKKEKV